MARGKASRRRRISSLLVGNRCCADPAGGSFASGLTTWAVWPRPMPEAPIIAGPAPAHRTPELDDGEPLIVASSDEIEILRVEGEDAHTLAVRDLPMGRPLELMGHGDVTVVSRGPQVRVGGSAGPMIWSPRDSEIED